MALVWDCRTVQGIAMRNFDDFDEVIAAWLIVQKAHRDSEVSQRLSESASKNFSSPDIAQGQCMRFLRGSNDAPLPKINRPCRSFRFKWVLDENGTGTLMFSISGFQPCSEQAAVNPTGIHGPAHTTKATGLWLKHGVPSIVRSISHLHHYLGSAQRSGSSSRQ